MPEREQNTGSIVPRFLGFWTEERSLTFMLFLLAIHFFILTPATFLQHAFNDISSLLFSLALLVGLMTIVRQKVLRWLGTLLVAGTVLSRIATFFSQPHWLIIVNAVFTLLALSAFVIVVFLQVSRAGPVSAHRIRGGIALYLLIAMLFAFLYGIMEMLAPGSFNLPADWSRAAAERVEAFYYFSIVTLTTVGFGDITPVHPFVRSLVMLEALIGQLYPAILLARLVSLEIETRRAGTGADR